MPAFTLPLPAALVLWVAWRGPSVVVSWIGNCVCLAGVAGFAVFIEARKLGHVDEISWGKSWKKAKLHCFSLGASEQDIGLGYLAIAGERKMGCKESCFLDGNRGSRKHPYPIPIPEKNHSSRFDSGRKITLSKKVPQKGKRRKISAWFPRYLPRFTERLPTESYRFVTL